MERITSRRNPLITRLRRLGTDKKARRAEGLFLCCLLYTSPSPRD